MTRLHLDRRLALVLAAFAALAAIAAPVLAADHAVSIAGKAFTPATITIAPGDTITWTVTESIGEPHSVTSGKANTSNVGVAFDSGLEGLTENGGTYSNTFTDEDTFDYFCQVHPEMTGKIIVVAAGQEPPGSAAPASEGPGAEPPGESHAPVPPESKALAAGILAISIVLMFVMAWVWRRMNPA